MLALPLVSGGQVDAMGAAVAPLPVNLDSFMDALGNHLLRKLYKSKLLDRGRLTLILLSLWAC